MTTAGEANCKTHKLLTDGEIETAAEARYLAEPKKPGDVQIPWTALPEFMREHFRAVARGGDGTFARAACG